MMLELFIVILVRLSCLMLSLMDQHRECSVIGASPLDQALSVFWNRVFVAVSLVGLGILFWLEHR